MTSHRIAVIRGDGIGVEVIEEGMRALEAAQHRFGFELLYEEFPWGSDYYFEHGRMMPEDGLAQLAGFDAVFFGAVGHPDIQDHVTLNGLLLPMRRGFDQYVCQRPSVLYPGVVSPLRGREAGDIDMVVIRENTEGEYANVGGFQYHGFPEEVAVQTAVFTRRGIERVVRYAFELARSRNKQRKVASITKSNAQGYGMVLWDEVFAQVAAEYPDIETESLLVDAACMNFIRRPDTFDVVVASNLFGDILTDIGAMITGSMGLAPSGNINPERRFPSVFEPVHGSAPDIAGKGIANPIATVFSAAMMLRHVGEPAAADAVDSAAEQVLRDGEVVPRDLGGSATTTQVGDAIVRAIAGPVRTVAMPDWPPPDLKVPFKDAAEYRQMWFRANSDTISERGRTPSDDRGKRYDNWLARGHEAENLYPPIREEAVSFFAERDIRWWQYWNGDGSRGKRPTRIMQSSQVACVNFLLPLASNPAALLGAIRSIDSDVTRIVPIEHNGNSALVEFEWIGVNGSLEGPNIRGQNVTNIDALIVAETARGCRAYLLEWKYTENYLRTRPDFKGEGDSGQARRERYSGLFRATDSSFSSAAPNLDSFLYDPFYQLMRQRLLADKMVRERELGVTEAKVVVVVPDGNQEYRNLRSEDGRRSVAPPLLNRYPAVSNVSGMMAAVLTVPDRQFTMVAPRRLLSGATSASGTEAWAAYWRERYDV